MGFQAAQIHASSPRALRVPQRAPETCAPLACLCADCRLDLYIHAVYLVNLAAADAEIRAASIRSLSWTLGAAEQAGAIAVTLHVGSHTGRGFANCRKQIASALEALLQASAGSMLLLENSAGAGGTIGSDFRDLRAILADQSWDPRLGICIDTAHAFATGYDFRRPEESIRLLGSLDETVGLERLRLVHVNDSMTEAGSRRDRHANIGAGCIGPEGFANLLSHPEIRALPLILETPNPDRRPADLAALQTALALAGSRQEPELS